MDLPLKAFSFVWKSVGCRFAAFVTFYLSPYFEDWHKESFLSHRIIAVQWNNGTIGFCFAHPILCLAKATSRQRAANCRIRVFHKMFFNFSVRKKQIRQTWTISKMFRLDNWAMQTAYKRHDLMNHHAPCTERHCCLFMLMLMLLLIHIIIWNNGNFQMIMYITELVQHILEFGIYIDTWPHQGTPFYRS